MKKILLVLGMVLMGVGVFGQGNWQWARQGTGVGLQEGWNVVTDAFGNVYATGYYSPTITFDSSTFNSVGYSDIFIVKYNANGNVRWAKSIGGDSYDEGYSIATDAFGNVFVTGYFQSHSLIIGTDTLLNPNNSDKIFIAKYDSIGNFLWAKNAGGTFVDFGFSVATDASGNAYLTGSFSSPTLVFGTTTLINADNTGNTSDIFLVKYSPSGIVLWATKAGGTGDDFGKCVVTDILGNAFLTGYFGSNNIVFGSNILNNVGNADMFISKYSASGAVIWANSAGGTNIDYGLSIATDALSNAYVTGWFGSSTIAFGTDTLNNQGVLDMFIVKYSASGTVLWVRSPIGTGDKIGYSIAGNASGIYVTGSFNSSFIIFGSDTLSFPIGGGDNMFIVKYDFGGNVICASKLAGGGDDNNAVATDNLDNVYIIGDFMYSPFIIGADTLTALSNSELFFIAKYYCGNREEVTELQTTSAISLYPNPATNNFTIAFGSITKKVVLTITDITGKLLYTATAAETEKMNVTTSSFAEGVYIVKIQTDGSASSPTVDVLYRKLVVEK